MCTAVEHPRRLSRDRYRRQRIGSGRLVRRTPHLGRGPEASQGRHHGPGRQTAHIDGDKLATHRTGMGRSPGPDRLEAYPNRHCASLRTGH